VSPTLSNIRRHMARMSPPLAAQPAGRQAAVAIVIRGPDERPELLFIERAQRSGDPWSGHMAFPGGRLSPGDTSSRDTAERETREEVGISLGLADYLGHLADIEGNRRFRQDDLTIAAHVYHLTDPPPLVLDPREVREAFWFPVADLLLPDRHVDYATPHVREYSFPGIRVGHPERHVVWGLTYRLLDLFLDAIERPLPARWAEPRVPDE
jgi:8-oxo-dGTP pyrophosphatase MutT (NUDIX family)